MPTLKEVLADKTKYPDNLVWNLEGGTAVTLAQLRGLSDESQSAITKREAELVKSQQAIDAKDAEIKKAQLNTANLYTALQTAKEAIANGKFDTLPAEVKALFGNSVPTGSNNNSNDPFAVLSNLERDSLLGPLVTVIKSVKADAVKAQAEAANVINIQKQMAEAYLNDRLEETYDRIVPANKQDSLTLEKLIQHSVSNKYFTRSNIPDIRKAMKDLTAADTAAEREAAIRKEERDKVMAEMNGRSPDGNNQIFVPQPQNFGLDVHNRSGAAPKPFKTLDEAFAAAANDKDIWANVDKTVQ